MTLRHGELDDSPDPWTFLRLSVHAESVIQRREVISFSVSSDAGAGCVGTSLCSMGAGDSSGGSLLGLEPLISIHGLVFRVSQAAQRSIS